MFFSAASGNPYSFGIIAAYDGTGQQTSLVYIPTKAEMSSFFASDAAAQGQAAAFNNYIDANKYLSSRRGQFTERNGANTPWNNQLDFRYALDVNFKISGKPRSFSFTYDIVNLSNLLNSNWGYYYYSPDTYNSMSSVGIKIAKNGSKTANPVYSWSDPGTPYAIDQFASRYQMQLGLRFTF